MENFDMGYSAKVESQKKDGKRIVESGGFALRNGKKVIDGAALG